MNSNSRKVLRVIIQSILIVLLFSMLPVLVLTSRLKTFIKKILNRKPNILWAPIPIIHISYLSKASRLYGYKSDTLVYSTYFITKEFDYDFGPLLKKRLMPWIMPYFLFMWAVTKYDIFQYFYDGGLLRGTFLKFLELPLLRLSGKRIVMSPYGADVRTEKTTRALGKYNCCMDCVKRMKACVCDDEKGKRIVNHFNKYSDFQVSGFDMLSYVTPSKEFFYYMAIDTGQIPFVGAGKDGSPVIIIHAPTNKEFKGTRFLLQTVEEIKKEGYKIELVLVEKTQNRNAREIYKRADIIADQFLIGGIGYFAAEGMALGKPVLVYIREPEKYLPPGVELPVMNTSPDNLKENLIKLIENPGLRADLGIRARKFTEDYFSIEVIGKNLAELYESLWR